MLIPSISSISLHLFQHLCCNSRFTQTQQRWYLQSVRSTQTVRCCTSADGQQHLLISPCHHLEYGRSKSCSKCHAQNGRQVSTQALLSAGGNNPLQENKRSGPHPLAGSRGQHPPQPLYLSASKRSHLLVYANLCSALN